MYGYWFSAIIAGGLGSKAVRVIFPWLMNVYMTLTIELIPILKMLVFERELD